MAQDLLANSRNTVCQLNMHYAERVIRGLQQDRLLYTVHDDIASYSDMPLLQHQFIHYCIRPTEDISIDAEEKTRIT